jgi:hypothetical protein
MLAASAATASSSASFATTRFTRPSSSARAASICWPVNSISSAAFCGTARRRATAGVVQNSP